MKMPAFIAREEECATLQRCLESDRSEFVIICGRRRIGKTFLVEQYFRQKYDFTFTGGHHLPTQVQLRNFAKAIKTFSGAKTAPKFSNWYDAFDALEEYLGALPSHRKKVIFIDEMPWIDTLRSDFVSALENFWNAWANRRSDIVLVATGSATSWMANKLIDNQGGLHNRITERLYLNPFTLKETEEYLRLHKCRWDRYQILQCYMFTGGVPYYLSLLDPKKSVAQNIDALCFNPNGALRGEFDELYHALFAHSQNYIEVVRLLNSHRNGLTRKEIIAHTKWNGNLLQKILKNLEQCSFIIKRVNYNKKSEMIYRLADFYTMFYLRFLEGDASLNPTWWTDNMQSPAVLAWMGLSFEVICLQHHQQIKRALGISGISTAVSSWRNADAQIDMIIERADRTIHLCEIKFSISPYTITKEYAEHLRKREWLFREKTKTNKATVQTFVTTYGLNNPESYGFVHSEVTMNELFEQPTKK